MPRCLSALKHLSSAQAVMTCLKEDPSDRVLMYSSDLTPSEFDDSLAVRTDDKVLVIRSIQNSGASSIDQFVNALRAESPAYKTLPGEIAVVGSEDHRNRFGRVVPADIEALLVEAEEETVFRSLTSAGGYEGIYALDTQAISKT